MDRQGTDPFLLMLAWGPPHTPYWPPKDHRRLQPGDVPWRPNVPAEPRADPQIAKDLANYYNLCETLDDQVGRLLGYLDESGLAANTLVLFLSDHGDMHGSHGVHRKRMPHEESVGVPMVARLPGVTPAGQTSDALMSLVDVGPSVLSICGAAPLTEAEGRDLSPAFRGHAVPDAPVYIHSRILIPGEDSPPLPEAITPGYWRAVVTRRHKLTVDIHDDAWFMTDLDADPYEMHNLANAPEAAAIQAHACHQRVG